MVDTGDTVQKLKGDERFAEGLEHIKVLTSEKAIYGELEKPPPQCIRTYLAQRNIRLYRHQRDAVKALRAGKNVIITTPTASGKTLAFNLPIFERASLDKDATALYIYPTKALSNDQLKVLRDFEASSGIKTNPGVYDGDTPSGKRAGIRSGSRMIITNPYELHHILPWHYKWRKFYRNLKFVVIDEAHRYRGVFGSNVAFLIRRFRRICGLYGSEPRFVLSTATLANPLEFGERLIGLECELVTNDGAPKGEKHFIFYNPYFDGVGERSVHQATKDIFLHFVKDGLQTLCFTVSRKMAELIALWSKTEIEDALPQLADRITAYRAGLLPRERREIEDALKTGELRGVTSTNALELGIDVGSLDSVVISGYPGTVISTWQQAGRAGRGTKRSVVTLVAFRNPLDQYYMKHPEVFFGKSHEHAIIDLSNPYLVSGHLMCAASERPLAPTRDREYFEEDLEEALEALEDERLVQHTPHGWVYSGKARATEIVHLDSISPERFKVVCDGELLETMGRGQAYREAHKGAVLLHRGETYIVEELDLENTVAHVKKEEVDHYTDALKVVDVVILREIERKEIGGLGVSYGEVEVREEHIGYKIKRYDNAVGTMPLDLPPLVFGTLGLWFTLPGEFGERTEKANSDLAGGLHGLEHAMIGIAPFHVMCDRWDIGGVSSPYHPDTLRPTVVIYDGYEGGIGLAEKAFDLIDEIMRMSYELVRDCGCEKGCPGCVYSPKCGNENEPMDKKGAELILEELLELMEVEVREVNGENEGSGRHE